MEENTEIHDWMPGQDPGVQLMMPPSLTCLAQFVTLQLNTDVVAGHAGSRIFYGTVSQEDPQKPQLHGKQRYSADCRPSSSFSDLQADLCEGLLL
ncbi:hypothetical protein STEG23_020331 [Scotinomys teguina]